MNPWFKNELLNEQQQSREMNIDAVPDVAEKAHMDNALFTTRPTWDPETYDVEACAIAFQECNKFNQAEDAQFKAIKT